MDEAINGSYIIIKALENGVNIIGLTRGRDTRFHHTEKLDAGEVYIAQFTEITSAIKIKGKAEIYSAYGKVESSI
jgi:transcription attenuation protein (tryptophan RNA-binding attenuator protein)